LTAASSASLCAIPCSSWSKGNLKVRWKLLSASPIKGPISMSATGD